MVHLTEGGITMNYSIISVGVSLHKNGYCGLGDGQKLGLCVWPSTRKAAEGTVSPK